MATKDDSQDEIDLSELLFGLRSHLWIVLVCVLCGAAFGKMLERPAVFEARAVFVISEPRAFLSKTPDSQPQFDDQVIELLLGYRFAGGVFEDVSASGSADVLTGGEGGASAGDGQAETVALSRFIDMYRASVSVSRATSKAIEVVVRHPDPSAAAKLANAIVERAVSVIPQDGSGRANAWMQEATRTIGEAGIRRDEASRALTAALKAGEAEGIIRDLKMELATARASYDLLMEAFKAKASMAVAVPEANIIEAARVPTAPRSQGISPPIVFGAAGMVTGGLIAGLWAILSGRIHSRTTMTRFVRAPINAVQSGRTRFLRTTASGGGAFSIAEPGATEILVALRSRGSRVAVIVAGDEAISPLPSALWLSRRLSDDRRTVPVIAFGVSQPSGAPEAPLAKETSAVKGLVARKVEAGDVLFPSEPFDFSLHFSDLLASLKQDGPGGHVILACGAAWSTTVLRATVQHDPLVIAVTKPGKTGRERLYALRRAAPPDVNIMLAS